MERGVIRKSSLDKAKKIVNHSKSPGTARKGKMKVAAKQLHCQTKISSYIGNLQEMEEDNHINPLPTPAFMHLDAANTETPIYKYTPSLNQRIVKRIKYDFIK